ncbi:hypothetical protein D9615_000796 [Tricholomella constricta]|uniref:AB hydrolase-1 domain-containing protein n=1 Tax=Tricholomella constricta TaxID=117010 RepID=A0A8H5HRQ1_9AGAR|nr:hypothetical protein D9615_000796 [Tricholomella constricta]
MTFDTLPAGPGVELSYVDSGAPYYASSVYTTIVAIHGLCFTNLIFQQLLSIARQKGVRFVAPNRRSYPGSTSFSPEEIDLIINGGTEEAKDAEMQSIGHQIAIFLDNFIQKFNIPPISKDGKSGGIIFLGWSLGCTFTLATLANTLTLPLAVRNRLASRIRSVVLYDPAPSILGLPSPEENWAPLVDTTIPEDLRLQAFGHWVTSYFDHGDLSKRDPALLSWIIPSVNRVPTIYSMPEAKLKEMTLFGPDALPDLLMLINFESQIRAAYRKACYNSTVLDAFPNVTYTVLTSNTTAAFGPSGMWAMQDDEKQFGGKRPVIYKLIPNINHFWHWADPWKAFQGFLDAAC